MAYSVVAEVQDALAEEVLHHRVRPPQRGLDAVEHDLLALGPGGWHPVGEGVEHGAVMGRGPVTGDPQHVERRVDSSRIQKRWCTHEVGGAGASVSVTL